MGWSFSDDQLDKPLYQVRAILGDTNQQDPFPLSDQMIEFFISQRSTLAGACADCCRALATNYSRFADQAAANHRTNFSQRAVMFTKKAIEFETMSAMGGGGVPFVSGISLAQKHQEARDGDRPPPAFRVGMHDNLLPVPPTEPETEEEMGAGPGAGP